MRYLLKLCIGSVLVTCIAFSGGKKVTVPAMSVVVPIPPERVISPIPVYIGFGLAISGVSRDCSCSEDRLKDLTYGNVLRLGYDFNNLLGIEFRYLKTALGKDFSTVESMGLFLKPQYHFTDQFNLYGLLGYAKTTVTGCAATGNLKKTNLNAGLGFEYDLGEDTKEEGIYPREFDGQGDQETGWGIWMDAQHILNKEGAFNVNTNVVTFGLTYDP